MADLADLASHVWYGRDGIAAIARVALTPASLLYGVVMRMRDSLYDRQLLSSYVLALPALSVGNLTVGGTGKTPVSSWIARRMQALGARPAIVLRGYGDDEPLVHSLLSPGVTVVTDADRVRGVAEAASRGADVAVLDDAFQHRRARRDADVVLVSAEQARADARLLPAGPYREAPSALGRASLLVVTRKTASLEEAADAASRMARRARNVPAAIVALALDAVHAWPPGGDGSPLDALAGAAVLAVAAVGEPAAFFAQLAAAGADVAPAAFPDHHAFTRAEAESLARRAERAVRGDGAARVVCTLKDAVKLGPLWPDLAPPLWYVSQRVTVEAGGDALNAIVARVLAARSQLNDTTGAARPS
ncbi:tetraacyldisaccharide 4'-kinase [Gemmatirosa kalamazoonensis]|uniref:tetraacyldisaccharide 4'-kinase n=1 Tax=Gemmatirosa kalamazoonensis TaxID=861299 RepID=UPI00130DED9B|nr:tetraacyldisaccharide 4'-kinase [Gemmatirosa kalamazoonensis]